mgnify:FL=1
MYYRFKDSWQKLMPSIDNCRLNFEVLNALYSTPNRFYHNLSHIKMCLDKLNEYKAFLGQYLSTKDTVDFSHVEFAIWYHDAICLVDDIDNEQASFQLAKQVISNNAFANTLNRIEKLIMLTKHAPNVVVDVEDINLLTIADIDLAILGKSPEIFFEYDANIRKEYSKYNDVYYKQSRIKVLQGFLDRQYIYHINYFREKYESQARKNLKDAITKL